MKFPVGASDSRPEFKGGLGEPTPCPHVKDARKFVSR